MTDDAARTLSDLVNSFGAEALGADPAPEALQNVLVEFSKWAANGADPIDVAIVGDELAKRLKEAGAGRARGMVDAALKVQSRDEGDGGGCMILTDVEPWPDDVVGADLLADLAHTFVRFLSLPPGAATLLALWTVHAHAHDASEISPIAAITSPDMRCGKTRVLEVLGALVPRPLATANITAAGLFRAVDRLHPTLLIDEADSFLRDSDELRGILNSGHTRAGAVVIRLVGDDFEPKAFSTWAPKAVALIGRLQPTLQDRSTPIAMRRRSPQEKIERVRLDRLGQLEPLRRKACRWARDNMDDLRGADPEMPVELHDRAQDNWRCLLAIADLAGGPWPEQARKAAVLLSAESDDSSAGVLLLADIRALFAEMGVDRLTSAKIAGALKEMEDRPWPEWRGANPSLRGRSPSC